MIRLMIFFLLASLHLKAESTKQLTLRYAEGDFTFETTGGETFITTTRFTSILKEDTSLPALPYVCVYFLIGPNEEFLSHEVAKTDEQVGADILLGHNPSCVPTNYTKDYQNTDSIPYGKASYPDDRVEYTGTHQMGGYRFLSFLVSPFRYDATAHRLYLCKEMNIGIHLGTARIAGDAAAVLSPHSAGSVRAMVANPGDMDLLYGKPSSPQYGTRASSQTIDNYPLNYLIITCDSLALEFQRLADWKIAKGVKAEVITVEDIYSTYNGSTAQIKIKQAIKDYYDNSASNLHYVLLGGDKNIVPVQNCHCEVPYLSLSSSGPSDIFYACLQNINWDTNGNGKHGEMADNISIDQDLAVTRLPVNTMSNTCAVINRIIEYERNPNTDNWRNQILMCGADNDNSLFYLGNIVSSSHASSEIMFNNFIANTSWGGNRHRFYDTGTDDPLGANYDVTAAHLQTELSKAYAFVNVYAHGQTPFWFLEGQEIYSTTQDAINLHNEGFSILTTEACHTNNINVGSCLGETLMRNPSSSLVAYYGSAREAIGSYGMSGPVENYIGSFYNILFNGIYRLGDSYFNSKSNLIANNGTMDNSYRWLYFYLNILCDPETPVYTSSPLRYSNVYISLNGYSFNIFPNVERGEHCLMSRLDGGESFYETSVNLGSSISFSNLTDEYLLCLTHRNYIPYRSILGSTVYLQNESLSNNLNVKADYTYIGRDVKTDRPEDGVTVESGHSVISSNHGVVIKNDFEVKPGASLRIQTY